VGDAVEVFPVEKSESHGRRIVEHLRGKGDVKMTTDEIMALMRGD
jgi:hypothetical protein